MLWSVLRETRTEKQMALHKGQNTEADLTCIIIALIVYKLPRVGYEIKMVFFSQRF